MFLDMMMSCRISIADRGNAFVLRDSSDWLSRAGKVGPSDRRRIRATILRHDRRRWKTKIATSPLLDIINIKSEPLKSDCSRGHSLND